MANTELITEHEWWQKGVIYQIYPRSFADSNGDGIGDLRGVISKLDYLSWLGVNAIWLSPIYPSPMADFGYDVANYCGVHEIFGTLEDFDLLVEEAHRRNLHVLLDFVPNHTSDQHPWFIESKSSKNNPKRDWYIWRDGNAEGGPPNNWLSTFGGSGWEFDKASGQYYYHAFLAEQPDLNWRNPDVQNAMQDVLRFWMERGVDGFRIDVIYHIIKDDEFRPNPPNPNFKPGQNPSHEFLDTYTVDQPEVHGIIKGLRKVIDSYPHRMMVGEIYLPVEKLVTYYGEGGEGVHLPFNFQLITLAWNAETISQAVEQYERTLPAYGWPNWVLGNHDNPRLATRIGTEQTKIAAMLLLTLRGTPTIYYGEELGMVDGKITSHQIRDPFEKRVPGIGLGRDPERTPMQWTAGENAGFAPKGSVPWLPIAPDHLEKNVEQLSEIPTSILTLYRQLILLRAKASALSTGEYIHMIRQGDIYVYGRKDRSSPYSSEFVIALNFSNLDKDLSLDDSLLSTKKSMQIVLSTYLDTPVAKTGMHLHLRANEGIIIEMR